MEVEIAKHRNGNARREIDARCRPCSLSHAWKPQLPIRSSFGETQKKRNVPVGHTVHSVCARCEPEGETCARCKTGSGIIRASKDTRLIVGERDNSARFAYVSLSVRPGGASAGQLAITD